MHESELKAGDSIYFMGIGGTGMAAVAGLCQQAGLKVSGSDQKLYPPTSTMLEELGIDVSSPYAEENLPADADMVVVANVLSRGHVEIEKLLSSEKPYTSFAKLLGERFLSERTPVVVAGTHGKTTTCSLTAHLLESLGKEPGFFIGGLPRNFSQGFRLGKGEYFVVEGDEYDTAFFDKGPKFLHYRPRYLIVNNIEFDHADIYKDVEAIKAQFGKLIDLVEDKKNIIANVDDKNVEALLREKGLYDQVTKVSTLGSCGDASFRTVEIQNSKTSPALTVISYDTPFGPLEVETSLSGAHNAGNILQAVAFAWLIEPSLSTRELRAAFKSFLGVKRRLDLLADVNGIEVYEDFAHHPTAMQMVIDGFRKKHPEKRLLVCSEWRSAIQRRNVMLEDYASVLKAPDRVFLGELFVDKRIPDADRMDIGKLRNKIGGSAESFETNADLLAALRAEVKEGDAVIFMSSGSFSGIQYEFSESLKKGL